MTQAQREELIGQSQRIHLYFGYSPRWMRQTGIVDISSQDPELVARSSPIRRQLLGAMGDASHPLGPNPVESPNHWFVSSWDQVPLRKWAEERAQAGVAFDFGLLSLAVSRTLTKFWGD